MYARISVYDVPGDQMGAAKTQFQDAFARIREVDGFEGGYFLVGCDADRAISITLWENQAAMSASRVVASRVRSTAAEAAGGAIASVEEYEVAVQATSRATV